MLLLWRESVVWLSWLETVLAPVDKTTGLGRDSGRHAAEASSGCCVGEEIVEIHARCYLAYKGLIRKKKLWIKLANRSF